MRTLITNCPNCGAALERDGRCLYCGTHVRLANEIDINMSEYFGSESIELMLNLRRGDEVIMLPLVGHIESVTIKDDGYTAYHDGVPYVTFPSTAVEFNFYGHMREVK